MSHIWIRGSQLEKWVTLEKMGAMSRIERSYENCKIYDNSQDHWQSNRNLFIKLQGRPIESYANCEDYEIYEYREIYDNSLYYLQSQPDLFIKLQGRPIESYENCENLRKLRNFQ